MDERFVSQMAEDLLEAGFKSVEEKFIHK